MSHKKSPTPFTGVFGPETVREYRGGSLREWLIANGLGGYASSTLTGANMRRYHGLLVAAVRPPTERRVVLSKVEEELRILGRGYALGANQYPGVVHPEGFRHLREFRLEPAPTYLYRPRPDTELSKTIWMGYGRNTVYVRYTLQKAPIGVDLSLSPLICWKSYHEEMAASTSFPFQQELIEGGVDVWLDGSGNRLRLQAEGASLAPAGFWHHQVEHLRDFERGLEYREDLYCPARLLLTLQPGESATLCATLEDEIEPAGAAWQRWVDRRERVVMIARPATPEEESLALSADTFLIPGANAKEEWQSAGITTPPKAGFAPRSTVMAGYPWFTDWGRDTMIALPGCAIVAGRKELAREILVSACQAVSEGMIPNRFADSGDEPEFNTVDATLWMFQALHAYSEAFDPEFELVRELWATLEEIIDWHCNGTRYGIHVDEEDGLLSCGSPGVQLTWMDARIGDWVVTPRSGKPVEINALWYNALCLMRDWAKATGSNSSKYSKRATKAKSGFKQYVRPGQCGLYDVLTPSGPDSAIRPNQLIAASLPHSPLTAQQQASVVRISLQHLITPKGVRTLAPEHEAYCPRYEGGIVERDSAYHQGTVWPWLLGPMIEAHLKVTGDPIAARKLLEGILEDLTSAGVGSVSEVYDGDEPQRPNGCPFQAWSVGEVLRLLKLIGPPPTTSTLPT